MGLRYSEECNFRCTSLAHGSCNLWQKNGKFRCKLYELWPKNRPKTDSRPRHLAALQFNRMHWLSKSYQRFNKLMRNFCESFRSNASFLPEIQPLFEYADVSKLMGPQEGAVNGSYTHKNTHKHTHTHTRRLTFTHPDTASHTQTQRQTYFFCWHQQVLKSAVSLAIFVRFRWKFHRSCVWVCWIFDTIC